MDKPEDCSCSACVRLRSVALPDLIPERIRDLIWEMDDGLRPLNEEYQRVKDLSDHDVVMLLRAVEKYLAERGSGETAKG
jgi:hypothetical protein